MSVFLWLFSPSEWSLVAGLPVSIASLRGSACSGYAERVTKFLLRRSSSISRQKHFNWNLYLRNCKYEVLAAVLAGVAVLCWKALK